LRVTFQTAIIAVTAFAIKRFPIDYTGLQQAIVAHGGVHYKRFILSAEKKGNRLFGIWAKMIYGSKKRKFLLKCFHIYLYIAIWVLMPIVWLLYWLTYPLFFLKVERDGKKLIIDNYGKSLF